MHVGIQAPREVPDDIDQGRRPKQLLVAPSVDFALGSGLQCKGRTQEWTVDAQEACCCLLPMLRH